jgi:hypothetical protein
MIRTSLQLFAILILTLIMQLFWGTARAQGQQRQESPKLVSQVFSTLVARFQKEYSGDCRIEIDDVQACQADPIISFTKANRFLILARGFFYDSTTHNLRDLLGVFVFDDSLTTILRTIDIISDAHEHAYRIATVWQDTLTIHGEGFGHDRPPVDRKYKLYFWENYR